MSMKAILHDPTGSSTLSLLPLRSFWVWFSLIFGAGAALFLTLPPFENGQVLYATIVFNFFYALLISSTLRDQMNCAMTCFLPAYMTGRRAGALKTGLAGNMLVSLLVFFSAQVEGVMVVQAFIINLFLGLGMYFLVLRLVLTMENSNWILLSTPLAWIAFALEGEQMRAIAELIYRFFWLAPLPAILAWWSFHKTMAVPDLQRRILEVPYSDPSLGGGTENLEDLEQRKLAWRDRKTQDLQRVRFLTTLQLPFRAGIFRVLELIIGRALLWFQRSEFWVIVLLLGVFRPVIAETGASEMLVLLYPSIFFLYLLNALPLSETSPFLPVSRSRKAGGVLLLNCCILFVFVLFMVLTTALDGLIENNPGIGLRRWSLFTLVFILTAPLFFMAQLVVGMTRNFQIGLMILSYMIIIFCWTTCINLMLNSMPVDPGSERIIFMLSGFAWLVYFLLLWFRFSRTDFGKR